MFYTVYRFKFPVGVHFGDGSLWNSLNTLRADTVFSALCIETLNFKGSQGIEELVAAAREGRLLLSDMFPYAAGDYYLPKPYLQINKEREGDSVLKKKFKKLKYIPVKMWRDYLKGGLDPSAASEKLEDLGMFSVRTMSAQRTPMGEENENGDALPFTVGVYNFNKDNGLYLIAGYKDESVKNTLDILFEGLGYSGLGGKRSAGLGRFNLEHDELPKELDSLLNKDGSEKYMSLSVCMAEDGELSEALEDASYLLQKRAGYVYSADYAPELRRKKDFYSFGAGSCFKNRFKGGVFNVKGNGTHNVYRYAVPMWMEIEQL